LTASHRIEESIGAHGKSLSLVALEHQFPENLAFGAGFSTALLVYAAVIVGSQDPSLLSFAHKLPRGALAAVAGVLVVPGGVSVPDSASSPLPVTQLQPELSARPPAPAAPRGPQGLDEDCLATAICGVKSQVRWKTTAWTPEFCHDVAHGVLAAAEKYDLSPTLLLAVMINESDLDEKVFRESRKGDVVYAKDSGLMGIRCVLDRQARCKNGNVKGMAWKTLMEPLTNIDVGARELASWRTAGVMRTTVRVRSGGQLVTKDKLVQCKHRTHAFWAHYNHGPFYLDHGPARHYPHRVAVIDYALARMLDVDAPELALAERITIRDPGQRARTPDRPVEERFRKLCGQIHRVDGICSRVATVSDPTVH
jgi:hypothetical protein